MPSLFVSVPGVLITVLLLRTLLRRLWAHSIAYLPGPAPGSWLTGNMPAIARPKEVGDADFEWTRSFGSVVCIKGTLGRDVLFTADPKALQYILNTSAYNFPKPAEARIGIALTTGKGLVWAEGTQHARQRKIMNPAFSYNALRGFLPVFHYTAQKVVVKLKDYIHQTGKQSVVVNIPSWLARTTLDALGIAAFDYHFGAIEEDSNNKLYNAYDNLFADAFLNRSDVSLVIESLLGLIPQWLLEIVQRVPSKQMIRLQNHLKASREVAQALLDRQMALHAQNEAGSKDVMSLLIRANMSEEAETKLDNEEILSQLTTLFLAGHETTASTLGWALLELSRNPDFQRKIRDEIKATRKQVVQRGDSELSVADLDSMKYLLAVMKETLRYHPIVHALSREAGRDDVIPLETPQRTRTGKTITSIPVSKGQSIMISLAAYNRLESVWGDDADQWKPERFLEEVEANQKISVGVISNIASFSSGLRGCIGWRFAMIEMQAILIELLENFEFSPAPGNIKIIRGPAGLMTPMIEGSKTGRTELPVTITPI